jgi:anthranilate synthase component 2
VEKLKNTKVDVFRNDEIELEQIQQYDKIILSPGPGLPAQSGLLIPLIKEFASSKSILGVCLGQQAIAEAFGGSLMNLKTVFHGVATSIKVNSGRTSRVNDIFRDLPNELVVGRYHSWVVNKKDFPKELRITAEDEDREIMALEHPKYDLQAVQFHPESVMTPEGEQMISNWLKN